jgi:hypothetical protein
MAPADHVCGTCGYDFCAECVVFPFGLARPPMCITCALVAGGVRRRPDDHPRLHPREVRRRVRSRRSGRRAPEPAPPPEAPAVPADDGNDWVGLERPEDLPGGWHITF